MAGLRSLPPPPSGRVGWPWTQVSAPDTPPVAMPRLTIVTPSYNQGHFLEETIRSVLGQRYTNLEYIVMDGGSTDDSVAILQRYEPWLTAWESAPDGGQADAVNKGWARATGDFLWWLNSDDVLTPGSLLAAVTYLQANPDVGLVHGDLQHIDAEGRALRTERFRDFDVVRAVTRTEWIAQPGALMRRSVLERVGPLDASLHFQMDFDYTLRVGQQFPIGYLRRSQALFRRHAEAKTTTQPAVAADDILRIYDKLYKSSPLAPALANARRVAWASAHRYAAGARHFAGDPRSALAHLRSAIGMDPLLLLRPDVLGLAARIAASAILPAGRHSIPFRAWRRLRG